MLVPKEENNRVCGQVDKTGRESLMFRSSLEVVKRLPSCYRMIYIIQAMVGEGPHYRKPRFCRVRQGLPSANSRAHGKHKFCRVCTRKHTVKLKHTAKSCFAVCIFLAHGKEYFAVCFFWHMAKLNFAVCFILAHGKVIKKFCLLTSKLFLHFTCNMWYSMLKFDTFLYLFVIFN